MPSMIRRVQSRVRTGERVRDLVSESLEAIGRKEGVGPPVVCRRDDEIAEADALERNELSESMRLVDLGVEQVDLVWSVESAACEKLGLETVEGRRRIFDLFAGTPPAAVTCIAISHLNDSVAEITGNRDADAHLDLIREGLRRQPEELQRKLLEAVSSRPVRAFIHRFPEDEIGEAVAVVERRIDQGDRMPLAGVTLAVKDLFALGPTTAASRILADYHAPRGYVATAVANLVRLGAVAIGKTNLDEFALGSSSESTAFWPAPRNPHDTARVPGGSSGGSAAAIAAGMTSAALGSDTAGSIRLPASYCGCVGLKPTYGLVSRFGLFPLASSLDVVGPLAASVEDAAILLGALVGEGPDGRDQTQRRPPAMRNENRVAPDMLYSAGINVESEVQFALRGLTVGVPIEYFLDYSLDERDHAASLQEKSALSDGAVFSELVARREDGHLTGATIGAFFDWMHQCGRRSLDESMLEGLWREFQESAEYERRGTAALDTMRRCPSYWARFPELMEWLSTNCGVRFRLISLPHTSLAIPAYFVISRYELASNLHRYDGLKYGRAAEESFRGSYHVEAAAQRMTSLGTQPKQRILMGIHALQQANHEQLLLRAQRARHLIRQDFLRAFDRVDLLLAPTVNTVAPLFGGFSDTVAQQQMDRFSVPADQAGVPAISVPLYRTIDESAPLVFPKLARSLYQSVQVIAPDFEEKMMFWLASAVERWGRLNGDIP